MKFQKFFLGDTIEPFDLVGKLIELLKRIEETAGMLQFPMRFKVSAESPSGFSSLWKTNAGVHKAGVAIPPEFSGPGGAFSPEDLYALAVRMILNSTNTKKSFEFRLE